MWNDIFLNYLPRKTVRINLDQFSSYFFSTEKYLVFLPNDLVWEKIGNYLELVNNVYYYNYLVWDVGKPKPRILHFYTLNQNKK